MSVTDFLESLCKLWLMYLRKYQIPFENDWCVENVQEMKWRQSVVAANLMAMASYKRVQMINFFHALVLGRSKMYLCKLLLENVFV